MFLLEDKPMLRTFLFSRSRSPETFKKVFSRSVERQRRAGAQNDTFQRAGIVITFVPRRRRRRRGPPCLKLGAH